MINVSEGILYLTNSIPQNAAGKTIIKFEY